VKLANAVNHNPSSLGDEFGCSVKAVSTKVFMQHLFAKKFLKISKHNFVFMKIHNFTQLKRWLIFQKSPKRVFSEVFNKNKGKT
jgi:hypothetical protein